MKSTLSFLPQSLIISVISIIAFISCEDETSRIGPSITPGEVTITIDSLTYSLLASPIYSETFDSKSGNLLVGNLDIPEYGSLECSFVTRFMCAPSLSIPDSLFTEERIDSCKFVMLVKRGDLTGDSVAPQKVSVFALSKQLPDNIDNLFDASGYYDSNFPLGSRSFVVSNIAQSDSNFIKGSFVSIDVPLDIDFGKSILRKYKTDPDIFQWPQTMTGFLPGFYVQQSFGSGCVANIREAYVALYYHKKVLKTVIQDNDTTVTLVNQKDSVMPFIVSPEVLSSNNVTYKVSESIRERINQGETILTTPCGYNSLIKLPVKDLIERYESKNKHLSTVNDLILKIKATTIDNKMGIAPAPDIIMVKASEFEDFFNKNKVPDNVTSFSATYNATTGYYQFSSLRNYIINLLDKTEITEEDTEFILVPVDISTEVVSNSYYGTATTYVTKCVPYTIKPTVTILNTKEATIIFSFSSQQID